MISLTLGQQLKDAGLAWTPAENDFFAIPDRNLDEAVFVISDMIVLLERMHGQLAVTFHGSVEWALDHVMVAELVWLPTEAQLRTALEQRLLGEPSPALQLTVTPDGYVCTIHFRGEALAFEAFGAGEAYAAALLHLLKHAAGPGITAQ
jgi:hypothetical protein